MRLRLNTLVSYDRTQSLAKHLEREDPAHVIATMAKGWRGIRRLVAGAVYKTSVGVDSMRAKRAHPFVLLPITWKGSHSGHFWLSIKESTCQRPNRLLVPQRHQRVHPGRAARRHECGGDADDCGHGGDGKQRDRVDVRTIHGDASDPDVARSRRCAQR